MDVYFEVCLHTKLLFTVVMFLWKGENKQGLSKFYPVPFCKV